MANYDPRKDRHKPPSATPIAPLDALLGPERLEPKETTEAPPIPPLDASALDDRWPLERPHVTPQPSALPQQIPQIVWISAAVGFATSLVASVWAWNKLRSLLKR